MIILQVIPQLEAGGAERTTLEVAAAIVAAGGRALVASEGGRLEVELAELGGELHRLPMSTKNPWQAWKNVASLAKIIRSENVDLVHARSRAPAWSAKWACDRTSCHWVTTYHGTYNARSSLKRFYNSIMASGERVIANSKFIGTHIETHHPAARNRITVIPRGVDLDAFDPKNIDNSRVTRLAQSWQIEAETQRLIALFPGRLTAWKGQREALHALGRMKQSQNPLPLTIFAGDAQGRTAYIDEMDALIEQYDLKQDVRVVGHCSDMPAAYALADFVMTPSVEPEAFGRTAAEAGAMGLPVIAADHGGAREVVVVGKTGWRVVPGESNLLAEAIIEAMSLSAEQRDLMGELAAKRTRELFSAQALQAATLRVYKEILD
ncbi:MAG: glycosyltransferase family 4 protein [Maricaulis sp.]|jgi:glycosyltransferase involved in cell wall biosynthesis|nr:glycosyltransferase family 4 protein [Maricaulis sp.]MDG2044297.1 glycosyltransferase family 4 protein [Maricaulis sp.]